MPKRIRWRPNTPAVTLIVISPFIGEVLNGATRISYIFAFLPQLMVWGCGALIIREIAHRWRAGWPTIIMLGLTLSLVAEVLVLQTSVAPLPWLQMMSIPLSDRIWGVNWLWLAFMLGYETIWIVVVPILITELIFPQQRQEAWLRRRGLIVAAVVFTLGCAALWAIWTQTAVPIAFHQPKYWPPRSTLLAGVVAALLTIAAAYALRGVSSNADARRRAPSPWIVGIAAAAFAFPWWILIVLVFAPQPSLPIWLPLAAAPIWAWASYVVIARWSAAQGWNERHRWALAFASLAICMLMGYLGSSFWPKIDLIAKIVFNAIAVVWMLLLGRRVWQRS